MFHQSTASVNLVGNVKPNSGKHVSPPSAHSCGQHPTTELKEAATASGKRSSQLQTSNLQVAKDGDEPLAPVRGLRCEVGSFRIEPVVVWSVLPARFVLDDLLRDRHGKDEDGSAFKAREQYLNGLCMGRRQVAEERRSSDDILDYWVTSPTYTTAGGNLPMKEGAHTVTGRGVARTYAARE
eukprot:scaffold650_cov407-Prasinococcus_capsulatus_cf.AAC.26